MKIRNITKRVSTLMITFVLAFTGLPMAEGAIFVHAATVKAPAQVKALSAKAINYRTVKLSWKKVPKDAQGYAIYKNGKLVKRIGKNKTSIKITSLSANTKYSFKVCAYRTYKYKQYFNVKTKKWQNKRPCRKNRKRMKTRSAVGYKNGRFSAKIKIKTPAAPKKAKPAAPKSSDDPDFFAPKIKGYVRGNKNLTPNATVSWSVVYSAQKYILYKDGKKLIECGDSQYGYGDEDVTWSETHTYQVSAVKGSEELFSETITLTLPDKPAELEPLTAEYVEKNGKYLDSEADKAYQYVNEFRMDPDNQWYYDQSGRVYTIPSSSIHELQRDENLETAVRQRAKEMWIMHYVNDCLTDSGKMPMNAHCRPDGKSAGTTYREFGVLWTAENLAYGHMNAKQVIYGYDDPMFGDGWAETRCAYEIQGHRRAMLKTGDKATRIGIACFELNGHVCWALVIGY